MSYYMECELCGNSTEPDEKWCKSCAADIAAERRQEDEATK